MCVCVCVCMHCTNTLTGLCRAQEKMCTWQITCGDKMTRSPCLHLVTSSARNPPTYPLCGVHPSEQRERHTQINWQA